MTTITLRRTPWELSVCKLMDVNMPAWAEASRFISYCKTADEVSLVCESQYVPEGVVAESGWGCMKIDGVLDFSLIGIIAGITTRLAEEKISVFVVSTHDTDYVLVKNSHMQKAMEALAASGYCVVEMAR